MRHQVKVSYSVDEAHSYAQLSAVFYLSFAHWEWTNKSHHDATLTIGTYSKKPTSGRQWLIVMCCCWHFNGNTKNGTSREVRQLSEMQMKMEIRRKNERSLYLHPNWRIIRSCFVPPTKIRSSVSLQQGARPNDLARFFHQPWRLSSQNRGQNYLAWPHTVSINWSQEKQSNVNYLASATIDSLFSPPLSFYSM